jgi:hypothetical protein
LQGCPSPELPLEPDKCIDISILDEDKKPLEPDKCRDILILDEDKKQIPTMTSYFTFKTACHSGYIAKNITFLIAGKLKKIIIYLTFLSFFFCLFITSEGHSAISFWSSSLIKGFFCSGKCYIQPYIFIR